MTLLGRVLRPHGLSGELRVLPINFSLEKRSTGSVLIFRRKGEERALTVERLRKGGRFLLLKLREINSIDEAEALRGYEIYGEEDEEETPGPVGKQVFHGEKLLGTVIDVMEIPGNFVAVVKTVEGKEVLIPLSLCQDRGEFLEAVLPRGLEEI